MRIIPIDMVNLQLISGQLAGNVWRNLAGRRSRAGLRRWLPFSLWAVVLLGRMGRLRLDRFLLNDRRWILVGRQWRLLWQTGLLRRTDLRLRLNGLDWRCGLRRRLAVLAARAAEPVCLDTLGDHVYLQQEEES